MHLNNFQSTTRALTAMTLLALAALPQSGHAQAKQGVSRIPVAKITPFSKEIDRLVNTTLQRNGQSPNPRVSDEVFLRRTYLNIIGRIPTHEEATAFLKNRSTSKRSELIDQLLDSPGYASHQFNIWADILRVQSRVSGVAGFMGGQPYIEFIKDSLEHNKPYDEFVRDLVSAEGAIWDKDSGAVGYYMRDRGMPLDNMANTAQIFLGTQLQCAQCHDHPFDKWTQLDFYKMAAFTSGGGNMIKNNAGAFRANKDIKSFVNRSSGQLNRDIQRITLDVLRFAQDHGGAGQIRLPKDYAYDNAKPNQLVKADTLFGADIPLNTTAPTQNKKRKNKRASQRELPDIGSRAEYAKWITSPDTPRFNTVIANRLWKQAMGLALIEPLDDINEKTQASNPELMRYLEDLIVKTRYDMKQFLRIVYNTSTYQREATRRDLIEGQTYHFPGPVLKRMSGEQIWDSLLALTFKDIDQRSPTSYRYDATAQFEAYAKMTPDQLAAEMKALKAAYERQAPADRKGVDRPLLRKIQLQRLGLEKEVEATLSNREKRKQLFQQIRAERRKPYRDRDTDRIKEMEAQLKQLTDKGRKSEGRFRRASELGSPIPAGHLARMFGSSDREQIENSNKDAVVTQVLALINGYVETDIIGRQNATLLQDMKAASTVNDKLNTVYLSMLTRKPTRNETTDWLRILKAGGKDTHKDLIWTLANAHEFIYSIRTPS